MDETSKCNRCGATLPPDSPEGLCPRCLIAVNLATQTEVTGESGSAKPPPLPVGDVARLFPHLEILECLGRGGMGAVYKARQPRLDRFVALKILSPEKQGNQKFAERFEREARALAKLHHPSIVTVFDSGEAQGNFYLLMEFVDGLTLRQLLHSRKLSPPEALAIVPKICEALQYAHAQGIVHRDIKPENILMDKEGHVKIADFGIAKILGEGARGNLTEAQAIGTPHYMSPEQIEKPQAVDHRADIYSLGVVFYEMLTGELPLGKFQPPSQKVQVDVRLDEIVLRALEKEPERRYQQVSEIKTQVETVAATANRGRRAVRDEGAMAATAKKSGIVRMVEIFFDITFKSRLAVTLLNLSALGFLGSLGFLGFLPGMQFCFGFFGFTGFFGLIGAAFLAEFLAGNKPSNVSKAFLPLVAIAAVIALVVLARHFLFSSLQNRYQSDSKSSQVTNAMPASAGTWSPTPVSGGPPDLDKIRESAKGLTDAGSYEDALQRYIWYFNYSRNDTSQRGVRLSSALSDWIELGRRYPRAREALIDIRDADTRRFSETGGYSELFQEVSSLNHYLNDEDATVTLFKNIQTNDTTLAQQCFYFVEDLLVKRADYQTCREYIGEPQAAFDLIRRMWQQTKLSEERSAARNEERRKRFEAMGKTNVAFAHMPEFLPLPPFADSNFVGQTRQLIEILVATGSKSDAQNIQAQALTLLNDPQLKTAVQDAEVKISGHGHAGPNANPSSAPINTNHFQVLSACPPYTFTTIAGKSNAHFKPEGVAVDAAASVYFVDARDQVICRLQPSGSINIVAGKLGISGSSDGTGSQARFCCPRGIAVDAANNIIVADARNNTIRRITPDGVVTTIAGLAGTAGSADGAGKNARFNFPVSVAVDRLGNIFVADLYNCTIRKVTSNGVVTTIAGQAGVADSADGTGSAALFNFPIAVAVDGSDNIYVADWMNNAIRKITTTGLVTTFAGRMSYTVGNADGVGNAARFSHPSGIVLDRSGNIYVADSDNDTIRRIAQDGTVTTLAGLAGHPGFVDGTGSRARFGHPSTLALDQLGNLYVTDLANAAIRRGSAVVSKNTNTTITLM